MNNASTSEVTFKRKVLKIEAYLNKGWIEITSRYSTRTGKYKETESYYAEIFCDGKYSGMQEFKDKRELERFVERSGEDYEVEYTLKILDRHPPR